MNGLINGLTKLDINGTGILSVMDRIDRYDWELGNDLLSFDELLDIVCW
jgi:hypothetical protein